jgi:hypothetical protein
MTMKRFGNEHKTGRTYRPQIIHNPMDYPRHREVTLPLLTLLRGYLDPRYGGYEKQAAKGSKDTACISNSFLPLQKQCHVTPRNLSTFSNTDAKWSGIQF